MEARMTVKQKDRVALGVICIATLALSALIVFFVGSLRAQGVSGCGGVSSSGACRQTIATVAGLPLCVTNSRGTMYMVRDATSPTALSVVNGSGAVTVGVTCDGSNWIVE
jgi:hypothetical protein